MKHLGNFVGYRYHEQYYHFFSSSHLILLLMGGSFLTVESMIKFLLYPGQHNFGYLAQLSLPSSNKFQTEYSSTENSLFVLLHLN